MEGGVAVRAQPLSNFLDSGNQWKGLREKCARIFLRTNMRYAERSQKWHRGVEKGGVLYYTEAFFVLLPSTGPLHSRGLERPWEDWWHEQLVWSSREVRHRDKGILYCLKHCFKNTLRKKVWMEMYLSLPWCDFRFYFHTFLYFADFLQWS